MNLGYILNLSDDLDVISEYFLPCLILSLSYGHYQYVNANS